MMRRLQSCISITEVLKDVLKGVQTKWSEVVGVPTQVFSSVRVDLDVNDSYRRTVGTLP